MESTLKFIQSITEYNDLSVIFNVLNTRTKELDAIKAAQRMESEQRERESLWELWKLNAESLINAGSEKRTAIATTYRVILSNKWIARDCESTCGECGKDFDEYYESIFCSGLTACQDCIDHVDMSLVFDDMSNDLDRREKKIKIDNGA